MTAIPNAHLGLDRPCPRCHQPAGQPCTSATGRTRRTTHDARFRLALYDDPVRVWLNTRRDWRTG